MNIKELVKQEFRILSNPIQEFEDINKRSLEKILEDYITILLASGVLAAVVSFIFNIITATYLQLFRGVNIDYWRLINYSGGISGSIFFFYLFAGTFLFFLLTLIIRIFVGRIKYTLLVAITAYAMGPILLFGWISSKIVIALGIWSLFLLIIGVKQAFSVESIQFKKDTMKNKRPKKKRKK